MTHLEMLREMFESIGVTPNSPVVKFEEAHNPLEPNGTILRVNQGWGRKVKFLFDRHGQLKRMAIE